MMALYGVHERFCCYLFGTMATYVRSISGSLVLSVLDYRIDERSACYSLKP